MRYVGSLGAPTLIWGETEVMSGGEQQAVAQGVLAAVAAVEDAVDDELQRLDDMGEADLERLREERLKQMKQEAKQREEWKAKGHGQYTEIAEEKDFFEECKKNDKVVCHFYHSSTWRCKIVDKHLALLAPKHLETRFLKLSVDRAPFLCQRLNIRILPSIGIVVDGKTKEFIKGFDDLGGRDDFSTEMLEWRLGCAAAIKYSGSLLEPPDQSSSKKQVQYHTKKSIRESQQDSSESD